MKKQFLPTIFRGFSLAEALITLLIVCLITLASVPVLTKKKKDITKNVHGKWVCTIKDGSHYVWTSSDRTWQNSGSACTFVPPLNARNFAVTAVGGGGGGAGAIMHAQSWFTDFPVEHYGKYRMVAVGPGGQGGKGCGSQGGGGAGGVGYLEYELRENDLQIVISKGAPNISENQNGGDSTDGYSSIYLISRNPYTGNNSQKKLLSAAGGQGGGGRWGPTCGKGSGNGGSQGGVYSSVVGYKAYNNGNGKGKTHCKSNQQPCFGYITESVINEINELTKPYTAFKPFTAEMNGQKISDTGRGGNPQSANNDESAGGRAGSYGAVMVMTEIYGSGGGGKAAPEPAIKQFYPSFDAKKLKVTVGSGGKGGTEGVNGSDGGTTNVGDLIVRLGGQGGTIEYTKRAYIDTPGGDGGKSPLFYNEEPTLGYGGLSGTNTDVNGLTSEGYGAGGGGGGVKPDTEPGNGADGAPGVVIIEW